MLGRGFLTARATVSSITDLAPASRSARAPKHSVSPQLSIHHLPVKRAHCQLDCPDVWQKRHALTLIVPPDSALAYPVAPARASAAPLCAAIGAFLPGAWRVATFGCTPAPVLARDAAVLEPPRPPPAYHLRFHQFVQPLRKPAPATARSVRISTAESPAPPRPHTLQSFAPCRRHKLCPSKTGRAATPPLSASIPAEAPANLACDVGHPFKTTRGTPRKGYPARARQRPLADSVTQGEKHADPRVADLRQPPRPGRGQPRTPPRRAPAMPLDELPSATQPELYSSSRFN